MERTRHYHRLTIDQLMRSVVWNGKRMPEATAGAPSGSFFEVSGVEARQLRKYPLGYSGIVQHGDDFIRAELGSAVEYDLAIFQKAMNDRQPLVLRGRVAYQGLSGEHVHLLVEEVCTETRP